MHNIRESVSDRDKGRVLRGKKAGEEELSVLNGPQQVNLRLIIGVKAQNPQGKDHGILKMAVRGFRYDAVQLAGVDEAEAL